MIDRAFCLCRCISPATRNGLVSGPGGKSRTDMFEYVFCIPDLVRCPGGKSRTDVFEYIL